MSLIRSGGYMKRDYSYKGLIPTLAREVSAAMDSIRAEYGFELGSEFEIVLCRIMGTVICYGAMSRPLMGDCPYYSGLPDWRREKWL